jgi:hypothetical protein
VVQVFEANTSIPDTDSSRRDHDECSREILKLDSSHGALGKLKIAAAVLFIGSEQ